MDEKYIAYETMIASREASSWAFWSMLAALLSAFATLIAACAACRALNTWSQQEKLRARKEFKKAVVHYYELSRLMPHLATIQERQHHREDFLVFQQAHSLCTFAWMMAEGKIKHPSTIESWKKLQDAHHEYMMIRANITGIQDVAEQIVEAKFIF